MAAVKRRFWVLAEEFIHTAVVGGYFVEGHAHAEDIQNSCKDNPRPAHRCPRLPASAPAGKPPTRACETGCTMLDSDSGE